ncbi:45879_t:CDS:2, partial [Gigaspora margarita]
MVRALNIYDNAKNFCFCGVFPTSNLKCTRAPKNYAIPNNFSIITIWTIWGKLSNLNTIKGYIKYINNHLVYYANYGPNFELEIISNHTSSDAATKTQRAINELKEKSENSRIISTKKARTKTVAKNIKKNFDQIAKENYHPDDQVTLKELSYTVANTPFQVNFGSQNIEKKHELAIVQIIDKYQIPRDGYRALSAIQSDLSHNYVISNQRTILTSKMAKYIPIEIFNLIATGILYLSKPIINLHISGNGHSIGKKINHIIITLAILDQKKELYLPNNYYTIVIYSDIEKYKLLKNAKEWEEYFLQPDITDPNNQDIIVEEGLYQPSDITPYIHVLVYHVPEFVKIHKEFGL